MATADKLSEGMKNKLDMSADGSSSLEGGGEECWICLHEGSNDEGKPLVRNCSCRGSAGL